MVVLEKRVKRRVGFGVQERGGSEIKRESGDLASRRFLSFVKSIPEPGEGGWRGNDESSDTSLDDKREKKKERTKSMESENGPRSSRV